MSGIVSIILTIIGIAREGRLSPKYSGSLPQFVSSFVAGECGLQNTGHVFKRKIDFKN
jgi:hypothetical protein